MKLLMSKEFRFEAAHRLPHHEGACRNLHGHSYKVVVAIAGEMQEDGPADGMIFDFQDLSTMMEPLLQGNLDSWDHKVILSQYDPLHVTLGNSMTEIPIIEVPGSPTAENMAIWLSEYIQESLVEEGFTHAYVSSVDVWETDKAFARVEWQKEDWAE